MTLKCNEQQPCFSQFSQLCISGYIVVNELLFLGREKNHLNNPTLDWRCKTAQKETCRASSGFVNQKHGKEGNTKPLPKIYAALFLCINISFALIVNMSLQRYEGYRPFLYSMAKILPFIQSRVFRGWCELLLLNKRKCRVLNGSLFFLFRKKMEHWYMIRGKFRKVRAEEFASTDSKSPCEEGVLCLSRKRDALQGNERPAPEKPRDRSKF